MKAFVLPLTTVMLAGCSASIPVHDASAPGTVRKEGTLLVLPRAELALTYDRVESVYTPGIWTEELLRCKTLHGVHADMLPGDFATKVADKTVPQSCLDFYRLGLDAARYDTIKKQSCNGDDAAKGWSRYGIDAQSLKVTSTPVRDPHQVYWVETPVRWLASVDVAVKYSPAGTVDGAKTIATNAWSDFAAKSLGALAKVVLPGGGGAGANATKLAAGNAKRPTCTLVHKDQICEEISKDLDATKQAIVDLTLLATTGQGPSFDKQQELLTARIKDYEALFEGSLTKKTTAKRSIWIPQDEKNVPCTSGTDPAATLRCKERKLVTEAKTWLCGNGTRQDPRAGFDQYQSLVLEGWIEESPQVETTLAGLAEKSAAGFSSAGKSTRGLPYRIVPRTRVKAITQTCTFKTNAGDETALCADGAKAINEAISIPQYGWIGRLAPKAGGRKATFDVDYNADTGELVGVQVIGEGSDAGPIQDALLSQIKADRKPTELERLTAEKERVVVLKDICLAYGALSAEKPDFCAQ